MPTRNSKKTSFFKNSDAFLRLDPVDGGGDSAFVVVPAVNINSTTNGKDGR